MARKLELTGKRFKRLTVLREAGFSMHGKVLWVCQCDCGKIVNVKGVNLTSGVTKSCGCLGPEQSATHHESKSHEYYIWSQMIQRCTNPSNKAYKNYGARGIFVCDEWLNFENFLHDMGKKPTPKHTLERLDNDKGYSKENCKWASRTEQNRNTRTRRDNASGAVGVSFHSRVGKYAACIGINSRVKHLGYFSTIVEAAEARRQAEIQYWGKHEAIKEAS